MLRSSLYGPGAMIVALCLLPAMRQGQAAEPPVGMAPVAVKTLVLIYDPVLRTQGNLRLSQHMRWQSPERLTRNVAQSLKEASSGFADFQIVDVVHLNEFPQKRDGFTYDEKTFLEMWANRDKAHQPDAISYAEIFRRHDLVERVRREGIQEIWLWGAPYFGSDEYAMKLPGDQIFFKTDNPWYYRPYDIPDCGRTVWVMGFNYERGEAEALHSFGHRVEGILSLTVGQGIWDRKKNPENTWGRFTRIEKDFPGGSQVGNVHYPSNGKSDYDYGQKAFALSAADDWLNYPRLTGATRPLNCEAWGGPDYHLNYMKWWLRRLPQAPSVADGFYNNWWKYVVDYDEAVKALPPPGGKLQVANEMMR